LKTGSALWQGCCMPEFAACFICAAAGGAPTLFFIHYSFLI
jgi:hypothetical protein